MSGELKMTKEEAIELLEDVIGFVEDNQGRDYDAAFRMAIEALKENSIPTSCRSCSNHPKNGGSGICHCILGGNKINV